MRIMRSELNYAISHRRIIPEALYCGRYDGLVVNLLDSRPSWSPRFEPGPR